MLFSHKENHGTLKQKIIGTDYHKKRVCRAAKPCATKKATPMRSGFFASYIFNSFIAISVSFCFTSSSEGGLSIV